MSRVIITGGTGLIGKPLSANLAKDYEVVVLSRNPDKYKDAMPAGVKLVAWDAKTAEGWGDLVNGAFAIINLAGAGIADGRWTAERKDLILQSRLDAGKAVLEAVTQASDKPTVVVQASGVGFYGNRGDEQLTERSQAGSGYVTDVCVPWEASTAPVAEMGVRHVIARTGIVLTTKGGALPKLMLPFQLYVGGGLGDGAQWMSWIHIDDQVLALRHLMEHPEAQGAFNFTAPTPIPNRLMTQKLGIVMDKPVLVSAPAFGLRLALGEMSDVVLHSQRALPEKLTKSGYKFRYTDVETALRDLI